MMIDMEKKDGVAVITINNPPMNVLCTALLNELDKALDDIGSDPAIRTVVLTGAGRAFVAGADIKEMMDLDPEGALAFAHLGHGVLRKLEQLPIPVIAAVNGFALGGGTEMALACDIRIASEAAKFGQPEVSLGVIPGFGGTQRLTRLVGSGKAKELIYTGDIINAKAAQSIGLTQQVVEGYKKDENGERIRNEKGKPVQDNEPVLKAAMDMATKIASKGPVAMKNAKKAMDEGLDMTLANGLEHEAKLFSGLFATKDQKEGMAAFVEKREPDFRGE
ncbi:MAG: enoyl-CoA hydratase/isomerase family protein [Thermoplasmata archaeon]|nr:enoyl-CoA hydratase/isomerase family protein [Thermoplasmata archaeon]